MMLAPTLLSSFVPPRPVSVVTPHPFRDHALLAGRSVDGQPHVSLTRPRHCCEWRSATRRQCQTPCSSTPQPEAQREALSGDTGVPESYLVGTPCFTRHILASPMVREDRAVYLSEVTGAVDNFLADALSRKPSNGVSPIGQVTLLLPQLNPALDVYDRRFLLQVTWAVLSSTVTTHALRTRVLVQGRRAFGAIPLSVAGLRRHFDADLELSAAEWSQPIRSGDLEEEDDLDDDDDAIIVISPTNAVSLPVIQSVQDCARRANGRPIILINARLDDVPSPSGVMQVSGRSERIAFLKTFHEVFYLRLLFTPGSSYPLLGILFKSYPDKWQVWRSVDIDKDYRLIAETDEQPNSSDIADAFKRDSFQREKELMKQFQSENSLASIDKFLQPQFLVVTLALLAILAFLYYQRAPTSLAHLSDYLNM